MSKVEEKVIEKIRNRAEVGFKKYGKTLERDDLSQAEWLIHAQEEALDLAGYLQVLIDSQKSHWPNNAKFKLGDYVYKKSGSEWTGYIVGFYSTALTPIGYCIESHHHNNSVQNYPEAALEFVIKPQEKEYVDDWSTTDIVYEADC